MTESSQPPQGGKPPAGFYPDSSGNNRWWDGNDWTEHMQSSAPPTSNVATAPPPKKSHTVRNVLLVIVALGVLFIGGCLALIGGAANEIDKSISSADAKDAEPGGPDNPLTIEEGKAFKVSGFKYGAGWSISDDGLGSPDVKGLKVTNNRDEKDGALVEIKFMKGNEVVALMDCTTEQIAVGEKTGVDCISADELKGKYDRITINDSF